MKSILLCLLLADVEAVRRELSVLTGHDQLRALVGQKDQFGTRTSALQKLLSVQGQSVTPEVEAQFSGVKADLDGDISTKIKTAHDTVQKAINDAAAALSDATKKVQVQKGLAQTANTAWVSKVLQLRMQAMKLTTLRNTFPGTQMMEKKECSESAAVESSAWQGFTFPVSCDMSKDAGCRQVLMRLQGMVGFRLGSAGQMMTFARQKYLAEQAQCDAATSRRAGVQAALAAAEAAFTKLQGEVAELDNSRKKVICSGLGTAFKQKCDSLTAYDKTVDKINAAGNWSHSDRVAEWQGTQLTSCLISEFLKGSSIDSTSISSCSDTVEPLGNLIYPTSEVAAQTSGSKYTCQETQVSLRGDYTMPTAAQATSWTSYRNKPWLVLPVDLTQPEVFSICAS